MSDHRYPALRTISAIFLVIGWIGVIVTAALVFLIVAALATPEVSLRGMLGIGFAFAIPTAAATGLVAISCLTSGEMIKLFIDIERNTRGVSNKATDQSASSPREIPGLVLQEEPVSTQSTRHETKKVEPSGTRVPVADEGPESHLADEWSFSAISRELIVVIGVGVILILILLFLA